MLFFATMCAALRPSEKGWDHDDDNNNVSKIQWERKQGEKPQRSVLD